MAKDSAKDSAKGSAKDRRRIGHGNSVGLEKGRLSNRDKCVVGRVLNGMRRMRGRRKGRKEENSEMENARG